MRHINVSHARAFPRVEVGVAKPGPAGLGSSILKLDAIRE